MTRAEIMAFNAGVRAVLDIARASSARTRAKLWRRTREGAADALDALADEAAASFRGDLDAPPDAIGAVPPSGPRPKSGGFAYVAPAGAGEDGNFGFSDAEIASPSRQTLVDWLSGKTPMLASHWSRLAAKMLMLGDDVNVGSQVDGRR